MGPKKKVITLSKKVLTKTRKRVADSQVQSPPKKKGRISEALKTSASSKPLSTAKSKKTTNSETEVTGKKSKIANSKSHKCVQVSKRNETAAVVKKKRGRPKKIVLSDTTDSCKKEVSITTQGKQRKNISVTAMENKVSAAVKKKVPVARKSTASQSVVQSLPELCISNFISSDSDCSNTSYSVKRRRKSPLKSPTKSPDKSPMKFDASKHHSILEYFKSSLPLYQQCRPLEIRLKHISVKKSQDVLDETRTSKRLRGQKTKPAYKDDSNLSSEEDDSDQDVDYCPSDEEKKEVRLVSKAPQNAFENQFLNFVKKSDVSSTKTVSSETSASVQDEKKVEQRKFNVYFKCKHCMYTSYVRTPIEEHIYSHVKNRPWHCGYCIESFGTRGSMSRHHTQNHKNKEAYFIKKPGVKESEYYWHIKTREEDDKVEEIVENRDPKDVLPLLRTDGSVVPMSLLDNFTKPVGRVKPVEIKPTLAVKSDKQLDAESNVQKDVPNLDKSTAYERSFANFLREKNSPSQMPEDDMAKPLDENIDLQSTCEKNEEEDISFDIKSKNSQVSTSSASSSQNVLSGSIINKETANDKEETKSKHVLVKLNQETDNVPDFVVRSSEGNDDNVLVRVQVVYESENVSPIQNLSEKSNKEFSCEMSTAEKTSAVTSHTNSHIGELYADNKQAKQITETRVDGSDVAQIEDKNIEVTKSNLPVRTSDEAVTVMSQVPPSIPEMDDSCVATSLDDMSVQTLDTEDIVVISHTDSDSNAVSHNENKSTAISASPTSSKHNDMYTEIDRSSVSSDSANEIPDIRKIPKFPCKKCSFSCGSIARFQLHCRKEHGSYNYKKEASAHEPVSLRLSRRSKQDAQAKLSMIASSNDLENDSSDYQPSSDEDDKSSNESDCVLSEKIAPKKISKLVNFSVNESKQQNPPMIVSQKSSEPTVQGNVDSVSEIKIYSIQSFSDKSSNYVSDINDGEMIVFRCHDCNCIFWSLDAIISHLQDKHDKRCQWFPCPFCRSFLRTKAGLFAHATRVHANIVDFEKFETFVSINDEQVLFSRYACKEETGRKYYGVPFSDIEQELRSIDRPPGHLFVTDGFTSPPLKQSDSKFVTAKKNSPEIKVKQETEVKPNKNEVAVKPLSPSPASVEQQGIKSKVITTQDSSSTEIIDISDEDRQSVERDLSLGGSTTLSKEITASQTVREVISTSKLIPITKKRNVAVKHTGKVSKQKPKISSKSPDKITSLQQSSNFNKTAPMAKSPHMPVFKKPLVLLEKKSFKNPDDDISNHTPANVTIIYDTKNACRSEDVDLLHLECETVEDDIYSVSDIVEEDNYEIETVVSEDSTIISAMNEDSTVIDTEHSKGTSSQHVVASHSKDTESIQDTVGVTSIANETSTDSRVKANYISMLKPGVVEKLREKIGAASSDSGQPGNSENIVCVPTSQVSKRSLTANTCVVQSANTARMATVEQQSLQVPSSEISLPCYEQAIAEKFNIQRGTSSTNAVRSMNMAPRASEENIISRTQGNMVSKKTDEPTSEAFQIFNAIPRLYGQMAVTSSSVGKSLGGGQPNVTEVPHGQYSGSSAVPRIINKTVNVAIQAAAKVAEKSTKQSRLEVSQHDMLEPASSTTCPDVEWIDMNSYEMFNIINSQGSQAVNTPRLQDTRAVRTPHLQGLQAVHTPSVQIQQAGPQATYAQQPQVIQARERQPLPLTALSRQQFWIQQQQQIVSKQGQPAVLQRTRDGITQASHNQRSEYAWPRCQQATNAANISQVAAANYPHLKYMMAGQPQQVYNDPQANILHSSINRQVPTTLHQSSFAPGASPQNCSTFLLQDILRKRLLKSLPDTFLDTDVDTLFACSDSPGHYRCRQFFTMCDFRSASKSDVKQHLKEKHGRITCGYCNFNLFISRKNARELFAHHHNSSHANLPSMPSFAFV